MIGKIKDLHINSKTKHVAMAMAFLLATVAGSLGGLSQHAYAEIPTWSGAGTNESPYLIDSCQKLWEVGHWVSEAPESYANKNYEQTTSIDCADFGSTFKPIGSTNWDHPFGGTFSGNSYTISNLSLLTISGEEHSNVGLFGYIEGATITDVHLKNLSVLADITTGYVGSLAGYVGNSAIERASVQGTVTSGMAGYYQSASVGGLIGSIDGSEIKDSYSNVTVSGSVDSLETTGSNQLRVGGFIGTVGWDNTVDNSYSLGTVSSSGSTLNWTGGFTGYVSFGTITNSFSAASSISASSDIPEPQIVIGAFIGTSSGAAVNENNYVLAGLDLPRVGDGSSTGIDYTANIEQFKNTGDAPIDAWDFETVWAIDETGTINSGFPYHQLPAGENEGDENSDTPNTDNDKNGDNIVDSEQDNVLPITSGVSGKTVVLEVDGQCSIEEESMGAENNNPVQDSGFNYPQGLMNFTVNCGEDGFETTVTQYYYGVEVGNLIARKYNPNTNAYFTIPGAAINTINVYGQPVVTITYQVADGGELDIDGTSNGVIVDPAGLAQSVVGAPNTGLGGTYRQ